MRGKSQSKHSLPLKIHVQTSASITDFQYNHNGTQLAVADSDGYVFVYNKVHENFQKLSSFKADQAAVWKVSWADPVFGQTLAIGSFKRKVAIFQFKSNSWIEVAYHDLHEGSVNHVEWASAGFGCKLFSGGSDGSVAILELKKNNWVSSSFAAHECSITSLSVRPVALNEFGEERPGYPMIATSAKDNSIKIWRHTSQIPEQQLEKHARIYQQVSILKIHKQSIRVILWKQRWVESHPIQYQLFTCSEDGSVKLTAFQDDKIKESVVICEFEFPVFRISQSMTGNLITVSVANEKQSSFLYQQAEDWKKWNYIQILE